MTDEQKYADEILAAVRQEHLFVYWESLSETERKQLLTQILCLPIEVIKCQQSIIAQDNVTDDMHYGSYPYSECKGHENITGQSFIGEGNVGCLIVAGGRGSRLRFFGPKGAFPISVIKRKSLFQMLAEKIVATGLQQRCVLPVAIMTSPENHNATLQFFADNNYFGLSRGQIDFFSQTTLPLLDETGSLFLDSPYHIAEAPKGNGEALTRFYETGLWHKWKDDGVSVMAFIQVDNPLADPFDSSMIGEHLSQNNDVSIKAIFRENIYEKVGVIVSRYGQCAVVEYSELGNSECSAIDGVGRLKHSCANISNYFFGMDFVGKVAQNGDKMPLHVAHKAAGCLGEDGRSRCPQQPNAWKFEMFIFDVLMFAENVGVVVYPRGQCFAPLKNSEGADSPETVRRALQERDRSVFYELTGYDVTTRHFELDQQFYYPTDMLKKRWQGRLLPETAYVSP